MKTTIQLLIVLLVSTSFSSSAQSVTGQWYGIGQVGKEGNYSQYLSELILNQKGTRVTGEYNYYFKNVYIPSKVSGIYNSKTRVLELTVFPLLNFKANDINGADCPMKGSFLLKISKVESTLSGLFETTNQYKYTCPEVAVKFTKDVVNTGERNKTAQFTGKQPLDLEGEGDEEPRLSNNTAKSTLPAIVTPPATVKQNQPAKSVTQEIVKPVTIDFPVKPLPTIDPAEAITIALKQRLFEESPVIEVEVDSLQLFLYDNGEVDGDTVAIFHNRKLLASQQRLSDKPIAFTIAIDTTVHEISMFAANLGTIPPNTALCVIMAGDKRYEMVLTSNYVKNGTFRFRKKTLVQMNAEKEFLR